MSDWYLHWRVNCTALIISSVRRMLVAGLNMELANVLQFCCCITKRFSILHYNTKILQSLYSLLIASKCLVLLNELKSGFIILLRIDGRLTMFSSKVLLQCASLLPCMCFIFCCSIFGTIWVNFWIHAASVFRVSLRKRH